MTTPTTDNTPTMVSMQLPKALHAAAKAEAERLGLSFSALVRMLLAERLRKAGRN